MPSNNKLALQRLIPRRSWTDGYGRRLIIWTILFAISLMVALIVITLLADLLYVSSIHADENVETIKTPAGLVAQAERFGGQFAWSWLPTLVERVAILQDTRASVVILILLGFFVAAVAMISRSRAKWNAMESARHVATWLRSTIHRQTLRLGPSDLTGKRYAAALKLFTDDVDEITDSLADYRRRIIRGMIVAPIAFFAILAIDWRLGLQCLFPTALCWLVYRFERKKGAAQRQLAEAHAETESRFLADGLRQTRLVRGYNMENFEQSLFESHLDRLSSKSRSGYELESGSLRVARFVFAGCIAIILLFIGLRVISVSAPVPISSAMALIFALGLFYWEASSLEEAFADRYQLLIRSDRIYRYLDEIPEVGQAVGAKFIQPVSKSIVLESVFYIHQGHQMLNGIDLRIEAKTQVALVSVDPMVSQAAAYLLPRFIEPTRGRVLFDGEDIAWGTLESIHAETLYVGGDDPVLSGTVMENLICGDNRYTMQEAIEAAKLVHVNKYLSGLPLGYETVLGERGEKIGVGEAFQLGLARAMLRDPAVLIIQEPNQILRDEMRDAIDDAYQRIAQGRTVIFLPTRLSTIRRCDRVILLHDGRVEGDGKHQDLLKSSERYRHWDYITFNSFSRELRRLQESDA